MARILIGKLENDLYCEIDRDTFMYLANEGMQNNLVKQPLYQK